MRGLKAILLIGAMTWAALAVAQASQPASLLEAFFPAGHLGVGRYAPLKFADASANDNLKLLASGKAGEAFKFFEMRAFEKGSEPSVIKAFVDCAVRSARSGEIERKVEQLRLKSDNDNLRYMHGWLLLTQAAATKNRTSGTQRALEIFGRIKEERAEYLLGKASCFAFSSKYAEARTLLKNYLESHPTDNRVRMTLADVYLNWRPDAGEARMNVQMALNESKKVLESDSSNVGAYVVAGMASAQLGDREAAKAYYRKALPLLDPSSRLYKNLQNALSVSGG